MKKLTRKMTKYKRGKRDEVEQTDFLYFCR